MMGQLLRNRYELLEKLGEGTFGDTFRAIDRDRFDELCVVKRLKPQHLDPTANSQMSQQILTWFEREAKMLKDLGKHPQIPDLLAYFTENNQLYIVQEFIEGQPLNQEIQPGKPLSESKVIQLLQEILDVLAFVHSKKVIHRDLKPANIMRRTNDGKIVLIDFGGVKELESTICLTPDGQPIKSFVICTPGYAPSEQLRNNPQLASDVYAVGKIAIEALTGIPAYGLPEHPDTGELQWRDRVQVSDRLAALLEKMVQDRHGLRYSSATEALQALQAILTGSTDSTHSWLQVFRFDSVTVNERGEVIDRRPGQANFFSEDLGKGATLDMVEVPGGKFFMGSPADEPERSDSESPQHEVGISPFFMGKFAVTQAQYEAIVGNNPSYFQGSKRPVEQVSWKDAIEFCRRLSEKTGRAYRLPSEAEWEYACRAGTTTPFYFGATLTADLGNYAGDYTYGNAPKGQYRQQTTEAGTFLPNAFGLYEMHGNVWEWCEDVWHENYHDAPIDGSAWMTEGKGDYHLLRGGSWDDDPRVCRSAARLRLLPDARGIVNGFRVVCSAP